VKAAVFRALGEPLVLEEVPDPQPAASDLVLRVRGCGICGSDLHVSCLPPGLPPGTIMGHEFAGEVVEVGREAVGGFRVGDRVCSLPAIGCGRCGACLSGDMMLCPSLLATGLGPVPGAYAEYVRVGSQETLRLPESVDYRCGALVEPLAVALNAVRTSALAPGDDVLVIGAGPIGLAVSTWARLLGARTVVVSEKVAGRLALARRFGATEVVDASREDLAQAFAEHAGGPPDVVFECVGVPGMLMQCIGLARPRGRVVVVGVCMQPDSFLPVAAILKQLQVNFVIAYRRQDFAFTLDMLAAGRIAGPEMVTDVVDLAGFAAAFEALKTPAAQCKVLLEP